MRSKLLAAVKSSLPRLEIPQTRVTAADHRAGLILQGRCELRTRGLQRRDEAKQRPRHE